MKIMRITTTTQIVTDDFDGEGTASTIRFEHNGQKREIDLNEAHMSEYYSFMQRYVDASRIVSASTSRNPHAPAIRAWASEQGIEVPKRGRISALVTSAYEFAHKAS